MKKTIISTCLFLGMSLLSFAQMKEGKISYSMDLSSDDPEMAMAVGMMQGSKMDISFMPGKSRADITMGTMMNMSNIVDEKSGKALMLMTIMGQNTAVESTLDELKEKENDAKPAFDTKITNETKTIAGYTCTKAIMTSEDAGEMVIWYSKDISANTIGQQYYNKEMPGFPMEMEINQQGMKIHMVVTTVDKKVTKNIFDQKIPEGYTVQTMEQLQQMGE